MKIWFVHVATHTVWNKQRKKQNGKSISDSWKWNRKKKPRKQWRYMMLFWKLMSFTYCKIWTAKMNTCNKLIESLKSVLNITNHYKLKASSQHLSCTVSSNWSPMVCFKNLYYRKFYWTVQRTLATLLIFSILSENLVPFFRLNRNFCVAPIT